MAAERTGGAAGNDFKLQGHSVGSLVTSCVPRRPIFLPILEKALLMSFFFFNFKQFLWAGSDLHIYTYLQCKIKHYYTYATINRLTT